MKFFKKLKLKVEANHRQIKEKIHKSIIKLKTWVK
jgi:hypothetical protein